MCVHVLLYYNVFIIHNVLSLSLSLQGIGDSGQGFANAILFVLFTPKVRRYFLRLVLCRHLWHRSEHPVNIQGKAKIYYGSVPSNSEYKSEVSDSPTASEGVGNDASNLILNKST